MNGIASYFVATKYRTKEENAMLEDMFETAANRIKSQVATIKTQFENNQQDKHYPVETDLGDMGEATLKATDPLIGEVGIEDNDASPVEILPHANKIDYILSVDGHEKMVSPLEMLDAIKEQRIVFSDDSNAEKFFGEFDRRYHRYLMHMVEKNEKRWQNQIACSIVLASCVFLLVCRLGKK